MAEAEQVKPPAPEVKPSDSSNTAEEKKPDPPAPPAAAKAEPPVEKRPAEDGSKRLLEEALDREKALKAQLAKEQTERMRLLERQRQPYRVFKPGFKVKKADRKS